MDRMGVKKIDQISLADAFANHIDTKYAMLLGMIPDCPLDKVTSTGNAAGTGARIALLNKTARVEIEPPVKTIEKIETVVGPLLQDHFIRAIATPHQDEQFPNFERVTTLSLHKVKKRSKCAQNIQTYHDAYFASNDSLKAKATLTTAQYSTNQ